MFRKEPFFHGHDNYDQVNKFLVRSLKHQVVYDEILNEMYT